MGNLWLVGMMCSGKTTVGGRASEARAAPFFDVDRLVELRAGKSVVDIFRQDGEAAFRRLEAAEIRRLADDSPGGGSSGGGGMVVSTGGGTVLDDRNVEAMRRTGAVVWLDAPVSALAARVAGEARPLLAGVDAPRFLAEMLDRRRPMYEGAAHYRVDADRPVSEVAAEVSCCARIAVGGASEILIGPGLTSPLLPRSSGREQAAVITQPGAMPAARRVMDRLRAETDAVLIEVPDREEAKTVGTLGMLYTRLAELNLGRHDTIVGVGGGAVTDLAGFAAATWLRGIESVLVPTTLLGAVDASIGGKTGINVSGKNLVGAFWHPSRVSVGLDTLAALPEYLIREGAAETVKAGFIADPGLVELFTADGMSFPLAEAVRRAVAVKAEVVSSDFREAGRRAVLNFGHTIGHGVEAACGLAHGHAVSVGMAAAAAVSADRYGFDPGEVLLPLERLGLPTRIEQADRAEIRRLISRDKKRTAAGLRMVLLRGLGDPVVEQVDEDALEIGFSAVGVC